MSRVEDPKSSWEMLWKYGLKRNNSSPPNTMSLATGWPMWKAGQEDTEALANVNISQFREPFVSQSLALGPRCTRCIKPYSVNVCTKHPVNVTRQARAGGFLLAGLQYKNL